MHETVSPLILLIVRFCTLRSSSMTLDLARDTKRDTEVKMTITNRIISDIL